MPKTETEKVHILRRDDIVASSTNRETFSPEALQEMADSILERGVIQPIIVRPVAAIENEVVRAAALKARAKYELIAGERRWRGTKLAKLDTIPALVRPLSDFDALMIQTIENAQCENPPPLEEAAQYDQLLTMGKCDMHELASRTGKNRTYIYGRLSLLRLPDKAKAALRAGKLSLAVALLLGRIPNPAVLAEAAERIMKGDWHGRLLSVAEAQRFIFEQCMMQLKNAPFDTKDKALVPDAGPCSSCHKRTGNEKELFADVGRSDVCIDTVCFKAKCDAARERLLVQAKEAGKVVLSAQESAQLYPHGDRLSSEAAYVELDGPCPFTPGRTWARVVAKLPKAERPPVAVAVDRNGTLHYLIGRKEAGEAVRTLDLAAPVETRGDLSPAAIQQRKQLRETRDLHERTIRAVDLVITALLDKQAKTKDNKALSRLLLMLARKSANFDTKRRVAKRYGFRTPKLDGDVTAFYDARAKAADPLLFALETLVWERSLFVNYGLPEAAKETCKVYGLDVKKIGKRPAGSLYRDGTSCPLWDV
ncbi:MAG: ParB/RepB/Spo0J family partition protein [Verrucomicrobiota bacterium]